MIFLCRWRNSQLVPNHHWGGWLRKSSPVEPLLSVIQPVPSFTEIGSAHYVKSIQLYLYCQTDIHHTHYPHFRGIRTDWLADSFLKIPGVSHASPDIFRNPNHLEIKSLIFYHFLSFIFLWMHFSTFVLQDLFCHYLSFNMYEQSWAHTNVFMLLYIMDLYK